MDRVLISWNVPNMITIPLMAALGYFAAALIAQLFMRSGIGQQG
jgi:hypothetical protein